MMEERNLFKYYLRYKERNIKGTDERQRSHSAGPPVLNKADKMERDAPEDGFDCHGYD